LEAKIRDFDMGDLGDIWKRPAQLDGFKVEPLPHEFVLKILDNLLALSSEYQTLPSDRLTMADGARILAATKKGLISDTWPCHGRALTAIGDQKAHSTVTTALSKAERGTAALQKEKDALVTKNRELNEDAKKRDWKKTTAALSKAEQEMAVLKKEKDLLIRKNRELKENSEKVAATPSAAEKEVAELKKDKQEWLAEKAGDLHDDNRNVLIPSLSRTVSPARHDLSFPADGDDDHRSPAPSQNVQRGPVKESVTFERPE